MFTRSSLIGCFLAGAVLLSGCSSHSNPAPVSSGDMVRGIRTAMHLTPDDTVSCPDGMKAVSGAMAQCSVRTSGASSITVMVKYTGVKNGRPRFSVLP